jgi:hypothetical protein
MYNVVSLCGQVVCSYAYKTVGKVGSYTHNPQQNSVFIFLKSYTQFCARTCALVYTHICMQFLSVKSELYALYTPPTITTTLNN